MNKPRSENEIMLEKLAKKISDKMYYSELARNKREANKQNNNRTDNDNKQPPKNRRKRNKKKRNNNNSNTCSEDLNHLGLSGPSCAAGISCPSNFSDLSDVSDLDPDYTIPENRITSFARFTKEEIIKYVNKKNNEYSKFKCIHEDCKNDAIYGKNEETHPTICQKHKNSKEYINSNKKSILTNLINHQCIFYNCTNIPMYFSKDPLTPRIFCEDHAPPEDWKMFKRNTHHCNVMDCNVNFANFNYDSYKFGIYCTNHQSSSMISVLAKFCSNTECTEIARWKTSTASKKQKFCRPHAEDYKRHHPEEELVKIASQCMGYNGVKCTTSPTFKIENEKGMYCLDCAKKTGKKYYDAVHARCIYTETHNNEEHRCTDRAVYSEKNITTPMYCKRHSTNDMTDQCRRCFYEDPLSGRCDIRRHYNFLGQKSPKFCFEHKKLGMVVVTNKNCTVKGCHQSSIYGFIDHDPIYCESHKNEVPGLINIIEYNQCCVSECPLQYDFIIDGKKFCYNHVSDENKKLDQRYCKFCNFGTSNNYACKKCVAENMRIEKVIVNKLREIYDNKFIHDKPLSKQGQRPDVLFKLKNKRALIVEIDEEKHSRYTEEQEVARMNEIHKRLKMNYTVFIRFNPDNFYHQNKIKYIPLPERMIGLQECIDYYLEALTNDQEKYDRLVSSKKINGLDENVQSVFLYYNCIKTEYRHSSYNRHMNN